jgi:hypothetical protein
LGVEAEVDAARGLAADLSDDFGVADVPAIFFPVRREVPGLFDSAMGPP